MKIQMLKLTAIVGIILVIYGLYVWLVKHRDSEGKTELLFGILELVFEILGALL